MVRETSMSRCLSWTIVVQKGMRARQRSICPLERKRLPRKACLLGTKIVTQEWPRGARRRYHGRSRKRKPCECLANQMDGNSLQQCSQYQLIHRLLQRVRTRNYNQS
jgi:hypothetical protein